MPLLNLRKQYGHLYKPSPRSLGFVDVPRFRFLMIDGRSDVRGIEFKEAIATLMALAYPVKFAAKKQLDLSYQVMPLEGVYKTFARPGDAVPVDLTELPWRLMSLLPQEVSGDLVDEVRDKVAAKKGLAGLSDIRVQTFTEGQCVQATHIGPYSQESRTIERMIAYAD
jgi:hypothetical protein